jgi:hypothetical protein
MSKKIKVDVDVLDSTEMYVEKRRSAIVSTEEEATQFARSVAGSNEYRITTTEIEE